MIGGSKNDSLLMPVTAYIFCSLNMLPSSVSEQSFYSISQFINEMLVRCSVRFTVLRLILIFLINYGCCVIV